MLNYSNVIENIIYLRNERNKPVMKLIIRGKRQLSAVGKSLNSFS